MADATSPSKHLSGQYKEFFDEKAHPTVEDWYINKASVDLRNKMKQMVHKVLAFDVEKAKSTLRTTQDPAILKANAIFEKNNGPSIISSKTIPSSSATAAPPVTYQQRTVQWLAFASIADQNAFRETVGMMVPPSRFSAYRHTEDFDPRRKYWKHPTQITDTKAIVCADMIHRASERHDLPCEVIAKHRTQTGSQFSWKVPTTSTANSTNNTNSTTNGGTTYNGTDGTNNSAAKGLQRTPWGVYGSPGDTDANKTQWISQTREDFSDTFFVQDKDKRRFQNYNDNYVGMLSKHYVEKVREDAANKSNTTTKLPSINEKK